MNAHEALNEFRQWLSSLEPGPVEDGATLQSQLLDAWEALDGGDVEGVKPSKGRIGRPNWSPPVLTFYTEQHIATGKGSSRAERHRWDVDVERGIADLDRRWEQPVSSGFFRKSDFECLWDDLFPSSEDGKPIPTDSREIGEASVDLHLGSEYFGSWQVKRGRLTKDRPDLVIPPGQFALLTTWERVAVPLDTLALLTMRFRFKGKGLLNVSGFHVDPGFRGKLVYAVFNVSNHPVLLEYRQAIFTIFLASLTGTTTAYSGERQNQERIPDSLIDAMSGPTLNLVDLDKKVKDLEARFNLMFGGLVTVGIPLLVALGVVLLEKRL